MTLAGLKVKVTQEGPYATVEPRGSTPVRVRLRLVDGTYYPEGGRTITPDQPWRIRVETHERPTVQVYEEGGWQYAAPL